MIQHAHRKGDGQSMVLVIGAFLVVIVILIVIIRTVDFKNNPEVKGFEIAQNIALNINELSSAEQGDIRMDFEEPYKIGFGSNKGKWVWIWQIVLHKSLEKKFLTKINQQKPQGVYVIVIPLREDKELEPQFAYIASYSLFSGDFNELVPQTLGEVDALCISKEKGKKIAGVHLC